MSGLVRVRLSGNGVGIGEQPLIEATANKQGRISFGTLKAKFNKKGAEFVIPGSGSLFQSVDCLVETPYM